MSFVTPPRPHAVRSDDSTSESKLAQPPTPAERARAFLTKMESVEAKAEDLEAFLMDEEKDSFDDAEDAGAASAAAVAAAAPSAHRRRDCLKEMQSALHQFRKSQAQVGRVVQDMKHDIDRVEGRLDENGRRLTMTKEVLNMLRGSLKEKDDRPRRTTIASHTADGKKWERLRKKALLLAEVEKTKTLLASMSRVAETKD